MTMLSPAGIHVYGLATSVCINSGGGGGGGGMGWLATPINFRNGCVENEWLATPLGLFHIPRPRVPTPCTKILDHGGIVAIPTFSLLLSPG